MRTKLYLETFFLIPSLFIILNGCGNEKRELKTLSDTAIPVKTIVIKKEAAAIEAAYSGTIEESESQALGFSVIGTVSKVYVSEGDYVKKGQLLAAIDDATYRNSYEIMLAKKKQAEDAYKRLEPMYKNGTLPEIKMIEIETALQEAKSALAIAKKNLDDCKLYSPTDGYVGKRNIESGMSAAGSLTAITIVKIEKVFAKISVPENEIAGFRKGQRVVISIPALKESYVGSIEETGVIGDILSHTYKVKIGIKNSNNRIKPGMICSVRIDNYLNDSSIVIPTESVMMDKEGKNFVYLADNDGSKAIKKYITVRGPGRNGLIIASGLEEPLQLIIAGQNKLSNGSIIKIVK